jgi:hypothetical protein
MAGIVVWNVRLKIKAKKQNGLVLRKAQPGPGEICELTPLLEVDAQKNSPLKKEHGSKLPGPIHYATGKVAYFWGISPIPFFLAHVTFEVVENTDAGMDFINKTHWWPGGKPRSITNMMGDNLAAVAGYYCTYNLARWGKGKSGSTVCRV